MLATSIRAKLVQAVPEPLAVAILALMAVSEQELLAVAGSG